MSYQRLTQVLLALFMLLIAAFPIGEAAHAQFPRAALPAGTAPFHGPLAVMVDYGPFGPTPPANSNLTGPVHRDYRALLVDVHGRVVASIRSQADSVRTLDSAPPYITMVSVSSTNLYYVEGDQAVRELGQDGRTRMAARLHGTTSTLFGISVSPDNRTLAVAAVEYPLAMQRAMGGLTVLAATFPVQERLYTQDLRSGAQHTIYTTTLTIKGVETGNAAGLVWPIGWRGSALVLAVGDPAEQNSPANPYDSWSGYHVVSSGDATRLTSVCPPVNDSQGLERAAGPVSAAGTACIRGTSLFLQSWSGHCTIFPSPGPESLYAAALAPAPGGATIAAYDQAEHRAVLLAPGNAHPRPLQTTDSPAGWLDATHLLVSSTSEGFMITGAQPGLAIYAVPDGQSVPVSLPQQPDHRLQFLGTLPGGLGSPAPALTAGGSGC